MYVDEYKTNEKEPLYFEDFLRKLKRVKYKNKKVKDLDYSIKGYLSFIVLKDEFFDRLFNNIKYSSIYLRACSAVKNGRDVTCEDVIIAYSLIFDLIINNQTEYIEKYFDEDKVKAYF